MQILDKLCKGVDWDSDPKVYFYNSCLSTFAPSRKLQQAVYRKEKNPEEKSLAPTAVHVNTERQLSLFITLAN